MGRSATIRKVGKGVEKAFEVRVKLRRPGFSRVTGVARKCCQVGSQLPCPGRKDPQDVRCRPQNRHQME